ncbi:MAG: hypothetical protein MK180_17610 [Rhodobacteraceae bacterium]|nr:hypothetical protein [Paracoccaceae bacterium]
MIQQSDLRYTSEVFARRFLDCGPDDALVAWAENMTLSGFNSDSLFILLGELEPFNKFEIDELLDRIQVELNLPNVSHREEALQIIATAHVRRFVQGKTNSADVLFAISELCIAEDYAKVIYDFYLLHFAADLLSVDEPQYYWPEAHRGNIEKIVHDYCVNWLEQHPAANWHKYEWSKE